jgi:hypothetical protein
LPVASVPKRGRALRPQAEALGLGRSHQRTRCREVAKSYGRHLSVISRF